MKIAIIDIGTNTFNLLIAQGRAGEINYLHAEKKPVQLGKDGITDGFITDEAIDRALTVLTNYKETIEEHKCDNIISYGTSAMRGASNARDLIDLAKNRLDLDIQIISGLEEANYIYQGVLSAMEIPSNSVILDIGGGSCELIICSENEVDWQNSFDIGSSRLLETIKPSNPMTDFDVDRARSYIEDALAPFFEETKKYSIKNLIGASGSFETFYKVINYKNDNHIQDDNLYKKISLDDYSWMHQDLLKATQEERLNMPGMFALHAEMIHLSSTITSIIIERLQIENLYISTYSLKEGVIHEIINL